MSRLSSALFSCYTDHMIRLFFFFFVIPLAVIAAETEPGMNPDWNVLTEAETRVIVDRGTEPPFSGRFYRHAEAGVYTCRRCGIALYRSANKFDAGCGWPAFDEDVPDSVVRLPDPDGRRTEIRCANCESHLGHVFLGERFTPANTRHCVNSLSMDFIPADAVHGHFDRAVFAGGCFWGVEYDLQQARGVIFATSGYTGGSVDNPTYAHVCSGKTGHAEAVEVVFDPKRTTFEILARRFFEIHDPTQVNRQGPDIGAQYRSAVFVRDDAQRETVERLIQALRLNGYEVATAIESLGVFYPAEAEHQDYYFRKKSRPYCHVWTKRF